MVNSVSILFSSTKIIPESQGCHIINVILLLLGVLEAQCALQKMPFEVLKHTTSHRTKKGRGQDSSLPPSF